MADQSIVVGSQDYPADLAQGQAWYRPTEEERAIIDESYDHLDKMITLRNSAWPEFNDRTLVNYMNDSDRRLNAYVPSRDAFDPPKDAWQSNVSLPTIKDRQLNILAGFALSNPDMQMLAMGNSQLPDVDRADVAKNLVLGSYQEQTDTSLESFWQSWEGFRAGTILVYEGYLKTVLKQKYIKSYDIETGHVEYDEREVTVDDRCYSYLMALTELYISDFHINDIQEQPRLAWVRYLSEEQGQIEFRKYPNWKYVKTRAQHSAADPDSLYFKNRWDPRVGENDYEVVRMYCKYTDTYRIIVNGVLLLDAPMLWRVNGIKVYPFAKSICYPFVTKNFFYGQSFADHIKGLYDEYNTLWNTMTDNQYRKMVRPILVGRVNTDALNLEDSLITGGQTKITVEDISQVKELSVEGINGADVQMLNIVAQSLDQATPSLMSFLGNRKATAREIVMAQDRLSELKSIFAEMLISLWQQKYRLRLANIQQNYPKPRTIFEGGKTKKLYRTVTIENVTLNRANGDVGTLSITFQDIPKKKQARLEQDIQVIEKQMQDAGLKFKKMYIPTDYLDNVHVQITMIPAAVYKETLGYKQASVLDKIGVIAKMFPQYFIAAQKEFFAQVATAYGDNPAKYEAAVQQLKEQMAQAQAGAAGAPPSTGGNAGEPASSNPPVVAGAPAAAAAQPQPTK